MHDPAHANPTIKMNDETKLRKAATTTPSLELEVYAPILHLLIARSQGAGSHSRIGKIMNFYWTYRIPRVLQRRGSAITSKRCSPPNRAPRPESRAIRPWPSRGHRPQPAPRSHLPANRATGAPESLYRPRQARRTARAKARAQIAGPPNLPLARPCYRPPVQSERARSVLRRLPP